MTSLSGELAVITGGGSGIGRELTRQLVAQGASVAMLDMSLGGMNATRELCVADGIPAGASISAFVADVSSEDQVLGFRDAVIERHGTDKVEILINNAGIAGGGSLFTDRREDWDRTFGVCWSGVYYMTRAFLPLVVKAERANIVNVSSACGFWASQGPYMANTAYSAAKFAVKGFTEALITDLKINAPHVRCSVAMPGHIGTDILLNSHKMLLGREESGAAIDEDVTQMSSQIKARAPMGPAEAATIILDAMARGQWRILVGRDAEQLDASVRANPEAAYDEDFVTPFG